MSQQKEAALPGELKAMLRRDRKNKNKKERTEELIISGSQNLLLKPVVISCCDKNTLESLIFVYSFLSFPPLVPP